MKSVLSLNLPIKVLSCFMTLSMLTSGMASADIEFANNDLPVDSDAIMDDIYVKLYLTRLDRAKLSIQREQEELNLAVKQRARMEHLHQNRVVTSQELEETRQRVEIAAVRVREAEAFAKEAEVFLEIAVSRISLGLEMPICAELR